MLSVFVMGCISSSDVDALVVVSDIVLHQTNTIQSVNYEFIPFLNKI